MLFIFTKTKLLNSVTSYMFIYYEMIIKILVHNKII